ncbi:MAG: magnesium transporter [Bacteroidales bacterium]|nr:magnesium transporter [Bacteroidales bacterium]
MAAQFELTREFIEQLKDAVRNNDEVLTYNLVKDLHAADIAELYTGLTIEEAKYVYLLLESEKAADVLIELEEDEREKFLNVLPGEVIAKQFIDKMDSDDAADILGGLSEEKKEEVLQNIHDLDQAVDLVDLLNYPEDTAGGLMAKELIKVNENWDVETCIHELRKQAAEVDEVYYVYVVDDKDKLKGTVSLKRIMLARSNAKISNIYDPDVISVNTNTNDEEVAAVMEKYDLVALPVVDSIGRLMGRITIDDVVDVIKEEAEKDYQMIAGITEDVEPSDNVFVLTRARIPWLLIGLVGGILGAHVIGMYESEIKIDPKLAMFLPLIAAMGGNVGVQSSSIVVQGLANKSIDLDSTWRKLLKELSIGLINAATFSSLILLYNVIFTQSVHLTLTVSIALFTVILIASLLGTFIPLLLNKLRIDPAVATGPFITTMNDILGLSIYLGIGRILYGVFHGL